MCTFCSDLPTSERPTTQKAYITLFLRPNDPQNPKEVYRFRILNFRLGSKNDRVHPFISRYVHNHWGKKEVNGKVINVVDDTVVCPRSKYLSPRTDLSLGYADTFKELNLKGIKPTWDHVCPICKHEAEAWNAYNNSGKTDRLASQRASSMKRQFQGVVPVYVIKDPVNPKNDGRMKVIIFNNEDEYNRLITLVNNKKAEIRANGGAYDWCNGRNALDLLIRVESVPVQYKNGNMGSERKITYMDFNKKPHTIEFNGKEIITKELIDKFEFDDQYYVKNTKADLENFYNKYFSFSPSSIPDEDIDIPTTPAAPPPKSEHIPTNAAAAAKAPDDASTQKLVNDLMGDDEDIPFEEDDDVPSPSAGEKTPTKNASVAELLAEMDFED